MEKKLKIIIILLIVAMFLIAIIGGILYFTTDLLKSKEALFQKYLLQNVQNIATVFDVSTGEKYIDYIRNNDYTENTEINFSYLETENDQEEIYKITAEGISNNSENAFYENIKASYGNEELANIELLRQNEVYGLRLSNLVQQFVSIENATMYYVVSNLGYNGTYFQEKINPDNVNFSGLFDLSEEEINTLREKYSNAIFSDVDSKSYSSKNNVTITLSNTESLENAKQYTLTLSKTEVDKIYRKILNEAINDTIILSKLEKIDNEIKEFGIIVPEGESLKERYTKKLQEIYDSIEYTGQNSQMITFNVYQYKGTTYRTSMKTDAGEYIIDLNNKNGTELSYKTIKLTPEGEDVTLYTLGKQADGLRHIAYEDNDKSYDISLKTVSDENKITEAGNFLYKSKNINQIKIDLQTVFDFSNKKQIERKFEENNNILLNNFESDTIENIFVSLNNRIIKQIEDKKAIINTKLLNNISIWIDKKETERKNIELNNLELKKQRFNNKFVLYEGENTDIATVTKLLKTAGKNMTNFEVIDGRHIKILIQSGVKNDEKAEQIINALSSQKYTYNIKMEYNEEGYINAIDISVYEKK